MAKTFDEVMNIFRKEYNGPKIAWFVTGGGFSALDFRKYPGSNRLYHTAIEPYSEDTVNFLQKNISNIDIGNPESFSFVNTKGTSLALQALKNYTNKPNLTYIVINSACSTDRYRRGSNRSHIAISRYGIDYSFEFCLSKLTEHYFNILSKNDMLFVDKIRHDEDIRISQVAISLLMNNFDLLPNFERGERLTDSQNNKLIAFGEHSDAN